jgi:flavin reductase (DIM6/NTAB) family NADH-FMN oxidoreductase RutF
VIEPEQFRTVLGRFASGVTIVTAVSEEGNDLGMTVSAFCSVSLEPPLILICIDRAASMHGALGTVERFAVSILEETQEALSRRFAANEEKPFDGVAITRGLGGIPVLSGTIATMECTVHARHEAGDHTIIVGAVERGDVMEGDPLIYHRGGYGKLGR